MTFNMRNTSEAQQQDMHFKVSASLCCLVYVKHSAFESSIVIWQDDGIHIQVPLL